jgi:hypothetical protein
MAKKQSSKHVAFDRAPRGGRFRAGLGAFVGALLMLLLSGSLFGLTPVFPVSGAPAIVLAALVALVLYVALRVVGAHDGTASGGRRKLGADAAKPAGQEPEAASRSRAVRTPKAEKPAKAPKAPKAPKAAKPAKPAKPAKAPKPAKAATAPKPEPREPASAAATSAEPDATTPETTAPHQAASPVDGAKPARFPRFPKTAKTAKAAKSAPPAQLPEGPRGAVVPESAEVASQGHGRPHIPELPDLSAVVPGHEADLSDEWAMLARIRSLELALEQAKTAAAAAADRVPVSAVDEARQHAVEQSLQRIRATVRGLGVRTGENPVAADVLARVVAAVDRLVAAEDLARPALPEPGDVPVDALGAVAGNAEPASSDPAEAAPSAGPTGGRTPVAGAVSTAAWSTPDGEEREVVLPVPAPPRAPQGRRGRRRPRVTA